MEGHNYFQIIILIYTDLLTGQILKAVQWACFDLVKNRKHILDIDMFRKFRFFSFSFPDVLVRFTLKRRLVKPIFEACQISGTLIKCACVELEIKIPDIISKWILSDVCLDRLSREEKQAGNKIRELITKQ